MGNWLFKSRKSYHSNKDNYLEDNIFAEFIYHYGLSIGYCESDFNKKNVIIDCTDKLIMELNTRRVEILECFEPEY